MDLHKFEHRSEPEFWYFLPAEPGIETSFRHSNLIVISLLALLVLGVFVAGWGSVHAPVTSSVPPQVTQHVVHRG
jgi:hypothetical protein